MKDFFTYIFTFVFVVLWVSVPISIIGYIFSDDSIIDVLKTSIILATGGVVFGIVSVMLLFFFIARR